MEVFFFISRAKVFIWEYNFGLSDRLKKTNSYMEKNYLYFFPGLRDTREAVLYKHDV